MQQQRQEFRQIHKQAADTQVGLLASSSCGSAAGAEIVQRVQPWTHAAVLLAEFGVALAISCCGRGIPVQLVNAFTVKQKALGQLLAGFS